MPSNIYSKKIFKVVVVVAILGLLVFLNPKKIFNPLRNLFLTSASPAQEVSYSLSTKLANMFGLFSNIGNLKKENEKLLIENQELTAENANLKDVENENRTLREQLNILPRNQFNLEAAEVIGQDLYGLGNWMEINKGEKNGIKKGMPVIVSNGILVGKVDEVFFNTSKIVLISNPQSSINAIDENTGAKGIVKGEFGLGTVLDMVLETDSLNKGDQVITSGIGEGMPRGLLIGKVDGISQSQDHLFQRASITSIIKFSSLQFVFVIKN
jgi:rod shape-determining protein MreC